MMTATISDTEEDTIAKLFADDGPLASAMPGFRARSEQIALARRIDDTMAAEGQLIAEAETGTGKTLAYLVPALMSDKKILISTHTRALQDQLMYRDLPVACEALGRRRSIALLKGRSNYLCPHRLDQALTSHQLALWMESPLLQVKAWSERSRDGDLSALPFDPFRRGIGAQITATAEQCLRSKCPTFNRCPLMKARQKAQDADIVISNHSLLLADARLKAGEFGAVLPDFDCIILDEAHGLPTLASHHFGVQLSQNQPAYWIRDAQVALEQSAEDSHLLEQITELGKGLLDQWPSAELETLAAQWGELLHTLDGYERDDDEILRLIARGEQIRDAFRMVQEPDAGFVAWREEHKGGQSWRAAPVETGPVLDDYLWQFPAAFILLSATFRISGSFAHVKRQLGLPEADESFHPSPFDYVRQSLVYVPRALPPATNKEGTRQLLEQMESLLRASCGRAFVLFTSHRMMRIIAPQLERSLPWPVLVQDEGTPRDSLLQQFRKQTDSVLCGTRSFWEGVDVPGESLSMVIIDKLPFAPPDDPLLTARIRHCEEEGGNGFRDIQLPEAIAILRQGVGRLIRSEHDRGVMAILDSRLHNRSYGREMLRNLPPAPLCDDLAEVRWFFESE